MQKNSIINPPQKRQANTRQPNAKNSKTTSFNKMQKYKNTRENAKKSKVNPPQKKKGKPKATKCKKIKNNNFQQNAKKTQGNNAKNSKFKTSKPSWGLPNKP